MRLLYLYLLLCFACCSYSDMQSIGQNSTESEFATSMSLSTERVFYRFYLLQRLKPAIDLFLSILNEKSLHDTGSLERICTFQQSQIELFTHPLIQKNVLHMCAHHDSKALIRLIETVSHYRYINDDEYVKEVVMLLLIVYENIIKSLAQPSKMEELDYKKQSVYTVGRPNTAQADMTTASLDTLLNTLDSVSEELEQYYHENNPSITIYWKPFATLILLVGTACFWYASK